MAVKSIRSVVESHRKLHADFSKQLTEATGKRPPAAELPTRELEREIGRVKGRLGIVEKARDMAVERYDTEIEQLTATLTTLEQQLRADKRNAKRAAGPGPQRPRGGATPAISVDKIEGIGETRRQKLADAGLSIAAKLAAAKPAVVSEVLGVPREQAKAFIRDAKKLTKR